MQDTEVLTYAIPIQLANITVVSQGQEGSKTTLAEASHKTAPQK